MEAIFSPVHIGSDLLHLGYSSAQYFIRVGDVENVGFEVHGLGQLLPPLELISSFAEDNVLSIEQEQILIYGIFSHFHLNRTHTSLIWLRITLGNTAQPRIAPTIQIAKPTHDTINFQLHMMMIPIVSSEPSHSVSARILFSAVRAVS